MLKSEIIHHGILIKMSEQYTINFPPSTLLENIVLKN